MTNTFRRHHKTVMWIIIGATIVTFVYYLTPNATRNSGGGGSAPSAPAGTIDGETVSQPQFDMAMQEAKVAMRMSGAGRWPTAQETSQQLPDRKSVV